MKLVVHMSDPPEAGYRATLQRVAGDEVEITLGPELPSSPHYSILVSGRPTVEELTASLEIQSLIIPWAGLPVKTRELMLQYPQVAVHNIHYNGIATAEMAVTLMLSACKFVVPMDRKLRQGDWTMRYEDDPTLQLHSKSVIVLGYGAIGRHVVTVCRALGMRVTAVGRRAGQVGADGTRVYPVGQLPRFLPHAEVVVVALPLTPETRGLLGPEQLALMPSKAVLVNVGRGPVVDEAALYHALESGKLFAAGLDVWYEYPKDGAIDCTLPSKYPFHELDNVVMSPHRGGDNSESEPQRMRHLAVLLRSAAAGDEMPNRVDVERGY